MTRKTLTQSLFAAAVAAGIATTAVWHGSPVRAAGSDDAVTTEQLIEPAVSRPSEERRLAFYGPGVVAEVHVKEGDPVKEGQVLAKQDDKDELVALEKAKQDAASTAEVDYERLDKKDKEVQLERKLKLFNNGRNAAQSEVDQARLAVQLADAQIKVAEQKRSDAGLDAQRQTIKVDHMQLRSTVDGIVQSVNTHPGEMADPQNKEGALVVVKNDPLWVEIHPAADKALKLQMGQELQVRYQAAFGSEPFPWQTAKVIYFAPKADAGSKTELVRLELANPSGQKSGLSMEVRLPASVTSGEKKQPSTPNGPALPPLSMP